MKSAAASARRVPQQLRARHTVDAILDAVVRILKREGLEAVTTNRVAEVAGVSVGSIYQYFPNKRAFFTALHDRHVDETARIVERTLLAGAGAKKPLAALIADLLGALMDAHADDPELHELLRREIPIGVGSTLPLEARLRAALHAALLERPAESRTLRDPLKLAFVVPLMLEALAHGCASRRPPGLSAAAAKAEAVHAVLAYLRS